MFGNVLPVMPKRFVDFGTLATGATQEVVLADRVELLHWRELTLQIQVHSHTLAASSNTIAIRAWPQSWTTEDPGLTFLTSAVPTSVTISSTTASPALLTLTIPTLGGYGTGAIGEIARFTAFATRNGTGTMQAAIQLRLSEKNA